MFQPGSIIAGRYQVIRLVGQGGMSNLYLAHDRKYNNAIVVVKEMTAAYSDPKEQQMAVDLFHREAKLLASLNHRHIPKVFDYFQFAGKYYLSMEFIDGQDLAQKLESSKGPLAETQVLEWGEQIATVLFYLHKHEPPIVFRDVKPSNIMLCDQGVKLIDFGIARHFDQAKKGDTMRIGSPGYAPPEQYAAQTDPRSDIYALGVTLHHALTGRDPTATQTPFLVPPARKINPNLSEATDAMLARATQLDPSDRYQNVLEMKNDIKHILQRGKQSTRVVGAPPAPPQATTATSAVTPAAVVVSASGTAAPVATGAAPTPGTSTAGSLAAAVANPVGTPTGQPPAAVAGQPTAVKKTHRPGKSFLFAACLLLLAGTGLFALGPSGRASLKTQLEGFVSSLVGAVSNSANPEDKIRQALMSGDPRGLLPLLGTEELSGLAQDKQALYRLNLLAAETSSGNTRVVHLLYPDNLKDSDLENELFRGATRALAAVNAKGGLEKDFLMVLPRTYSEGQLERLINRLVTESPAGKQRILIFDPKTESARFGPETKNQAIFLLAPKAPESPTTLPDLFSDTPDLWALFSFPQTEDTGKLLWGVPGPVPKDQAERVEVGADPKNIERLLQRAVSENGKLVLVADGLKLDDEALAGRVLLLATKESQLPKLGPKLKGEALILGSSLRVAPVESGANPLSLSPSEALDWSEARVFDAVILSALPPDQAFSGITIARTTKKKFVPGVAVRYRWTTTGWVPVL